MPWISVKWESVVYIFVKWEIGTHVVLSSLWRTAPQDLVLMFINYFLISEFIVILIQMVVIITRKNNNNNSNKNNNNNNKLFYKSRH